MNEEHFQFLANVNHVPQANVGRNALNFGNDVQGIEILPTQLNQKFTRQTLLELCGNNQVSDLAAVVAILAWGGMRYGHARSFLDQDNWPQVADLFNKLRGGNIASREEAFELFRQARQNGHLKGLGVSYFSKLICFLNPGLNGIILDQWTAKSINLLWDDHLVMMSRDGWVKDHNNGLIYEQFCTRVEILAHHLDITPLEAEERIFSNGGTNPGAWRQYVNQHYVHNGQ